MSRLRDSWRKWLPRIALYGALHYFLLLVLDSVVFLFVHFPRSVVDLSPAVIGLTYVEQGLNLPRILLRLAWPGETTPGWLNLLLLILNSLVFGTLWYWWRRKRRT